jgi:hypothetical protein
MVTLPATMQNPSCCCLEEKEKDRNDYTFWRQFNEQPSIIPGCPGSAVLNALSHSFTTVKQMLEMELAKQAHDLQHELQHELAYSEHINAERSHAQCYKLVI